MRDQGTRDIWREGWGERRIDVHRLDKLKMDLDWLRLFPFIGSAENHDPGDEDRSQR